MKKRRARGLVTRRVFMKGSAAVASGLALAQVLPGCESPLEGEAGAARADAPPAAPTRELVLTVNGEALSATVEPRSTLAEVLRDELGLTGTKIGCDRAACGACTVHLDGKAVLACSVLAVEAHGRSLTTIEGLASADALHPVQQAFVECDALQCGFCTPGMIMSCKALLDSNPTPSLQQIKDGVAGNLCRCGTYSRVFQAVLDASGQLARRSG